MDPALRQALTNLKGLLDEDFISAAEYQKRRLALLDDATKLQPSSKSTGKSTVFDRLGDPQQAAQKKSVFSRLGGSGASASGHAKSGNQREVTIAHKGKGQAGDLREKLGGGIKKPGKVKQSFQAQGGKGNEPRGRGPAKCPW